MFNAGEVDDLFASTTRALQRSLVLLDERRTTVLSPTALSPTFCPPSASAASTAVGGAAASSGYGGSSSGSFAETVRTLQALGAFRAFVEATTAMQERVEAELQAPSSALQQRRTKGQDFALLQSVTRGLHGATAASWRTSDAIADLWACGTTAGDEGGNEDSAGDAEGHVASSTVAMTSSGSSGGFSGALGSSGGSGAQVTATLLFGAFCVDVALAVPRAAPAIAVDLQRVLAAPGTPSGSGDAAPPTAPLASEWSKEGNVRLHALLREVEALLPKAVMGRLMSRMAHLLLRPLPAASPAGVRDASPLLGCWQLSGGQFLFPGLDSYLLDRYPTSLAARWFVMPLQSAAQHLRADFFRSAADFALQCRWLLSLVVVLVQACQTADEKADSSSGGAHAAGRHVRTVQRLYDAWLLPLEKAFGHDAARHGMSALFYDNLVVPHASLLQRLRGTDTEAVEASAVSGGGSDTSVSRTWASVLRTAQYRLLLVVEKLAQSELAQANGTSSAAAKQRTYEALLRQNGGKMSLSLLQTLAEDKQFVLEETPSRSPDGHRLYQLHDGMLAHSGGGGGGAKAVFVYVDDGALFTKVGRARVFQRVKSVEDIFKPLQ